MEDLAEISIDDLLSRMSLEEKIGQLNQPQGSENITPEDIRSGTVDSLIKSAGALTGMSRSGSLGVEQANQFQQVAMESR